LVEHRLSLIDACDRAVNILSRAPQMRGLYEKATRSLGAGELHIEIMNNAADALADENLCAEVFSSNENLVSFMCGIWIQFLLVDIAGVKKAKLTTFAINLLIGDQDRRCVH